MLPRLEPVLELNVAKEVDKDSLAFCCAGEAAAAGVRPGPDAVKRLLEAGRGIDRRFLAGIERFPVRIVIRYEEVLPLRSRRIALLLEAGYAVLSSWQPEARLRHALSGAFAPPDAEALLLELLDLYARETQALGRSLRVPALLAPVRDRLAQTLAHALREASVQVARDAVRRVYRPDRAFASHNPS